jgi:peptidoglycan/xylan/chitin deacetylase (PgdA/CDA1 family)
VLGLNRTIRALRGLRSCFTARGLILTYHRIADVAGDPWRLAVSPRNFAEQLEVLRKYGRVMPLPQMVSWLEHKSSPGRAIALTFDDGYADALTDAKPLLEQFGSAATVFVISGGLGEKQTLWWDELEALFLQPGSLPPTLELTIEGRSYNWNLRDVAHWSDQDCFKYRSWKAWENPPTARHTIYFSLWGVLRKLNEKERLQVFEELRMWAQVKPSSGPAVRLSTEQTVELSRGGLIEIGAHSVTHPMLAALPVASQRAEIQQSRSDLEEIVGQRVESFAFPYGNYAPETVSLVREAGFKQACSVVATLARKGCNRFELPRVQVQNWDGEMFARQLAKYFSA